MSVKFLIVSQNIGRWYTDLTMSYIRAFKKQNIEFISYDLSFERSNGFLTKLQNQKIFTQILLKKLNNRFIEFAKGNDANAIFVVKGTNLLPQTLQAIKETFPNKILICFNPDDPFNRGSGSLNIEESIPFYDQYYIWSHSLVQKIKNYGAKSVYYLPFAADNEIIYPNNSVKEFIDVSFIGNGDKERNIFLKNIEKSLANKNLTDLNIKICGNGWDNFRSIKRSKEIEGNNLLKTFSSTRINLNILREANKNSINMRTFEIPASGGFMLHEKSDEAAEFFRPGIEADYFADTEECIEKIYYYLKRDSLRNVIAKAGYERIHKYEYTYRSNVRNILSKIRT